MQMEKTKKLCCLTTTQTKPGQVRHQKGLSDQALGDCERAETAGGTATRPTMIQPK